MSKDWQILSNNKPKTKLKLGKYQGKTEKKWSKVEWKLRKNWRKWGIKTEKIRPKIIQLIQLLVCRTLFNRFLNRILKIPSINHNTIYVQTFPPQPNGIFKQYLNHLFSIKAKLNKKRKLNVIATCICSFFLSANLVKYRSITSFLRRPYHSSRWILKSFLLHFLNWWHFDILQITFQASVTISQELWHDLNFPAVFERAIIVGMERSCSCIRPIPVKIASQLLG